MGKTVTSELGFGGAWENLITEECSRMLAAGICDVSKNHEAPKIRTGSHVRTQTSKPDFSGYIIEPAPFLLLGQHVVFEAKATELASFPLAKLMKHQRERLLRADKAGCIAFLYVMSVRDESKWVFPMWFVEQMGELRSSIPFDEDVFKKVRPESWLDTYHRLCAEGVWVF